MPVIVRLKAYHLLPDYHPGALEERMADANIVSELKLRIQSRQQRVVRRRAVVLDYSPWDVISLETDEPGDGVAEDLVPDRPQVSLQPVRRGG